MTINKMHQKDQQPSTPEAQTLLDVLKRDFDVLAVICLAVLPDVLYCYAPTNAGVTDSAAFGDQYLFYEMASLTVRSFQVVVPLLLIMHLRKVDWEEFGVRRFRPFADPLQGIAICALSVVVVGLVMGAILNAGVKLEYEEEVAEEIFAAPEQGILLPWTLIVFAYLANSVAEELAMRSYLQTRTEQISASPLVAILTTAVIFASYHAYQGSMAVVSVLVFGLLFGFIFHQTRRLWPLVIAHTLYNAVVHLQSV